ncbi:chemotaxis protein CheW [Roseomonas sp. 18066]|uniref:chemotaxis protein CheW n=1 Tax=Roseomonas sp. 18066 TaxID=2681412 RepID=UPI00135A2BA7|nr:chemotaxis protein CheW [Roseomonas sp. 18066]
MPKTLQSLPSLAHRAERILQERTAALAARPALLAPAAPKISLLACAVGAELYGLPIAAVAQAVPQGPCARLPGAPPALLGLFGQAGQVFCVLDLGALFGQPGDAASPGHFLLLRHDRAAGAPRFALRADRVIGAVRVAPPDESDEEARPAGSPVTGHARLDDGRLVALLALDRLLLPYLPAPFPTPRGA